MADAGSLLMALLALLAVIAPLGLAWALLDWRERRQFAELSPRHRRPR